MVKVIKLRRSDLKDIKCDIKDFNFIINFYFPLMKHITPRKPLFTDRSHTDKKSTAPTTPMLSQRTFNMTNTNEKP
jgi:hypothetical protein